MFTAPPTLSLLRGGGLEGSDHNIQRLYRDLNPGPMLVTADNYQGAFKVMPSVPNREACTSQNITVRQLIVAAHSSNLYKLHKYVPSPSALSPKNAST